MIRLQAKNGYKVTAEEIEWDLHSRPPRDRLLDRDRSYWMRFIVNGELDTDLVLSKNYKAAQLPFIKAEMKRLKWLPT